MFQNEFGHSPGGRDGGQPPSPRVYGPTDRQQHVQAETTRQRGVCLSSSYPPRMPDWGCSSDHTCSCHDWCGPSTSLLVFLRQLHLISFIHPQNISIPGLPGLPRLQCEISPSFVALLCLLVSRPWPASTVAIQFPVVSKSMSILRDIVRD